MVPNWLLDSRISNQNVYVPHQRAMHASFKPLFDRPPRFLCGIVPRSISNNDRSRRDPTGFLERAADEVAQLMAGDL